MKTQPRGLRNNNPGNIRNNSDHFQGEIRPSADSVFKQFETMAYGYRAMFKILINYQNKHHLNTIRKMISRWAPDIENNTDAYIQAVSEESGIPEDDHIDPDSELMMTRIVAAMSRVENGVPAVLTDVIEGWKLL